MIQNGYGMQGLIYIWKEKKKGRKKRNNVIRGKTVLVEKPVLADCQVAGCCFVHETVYFTLDGCGSGAVRAENTHPGAVFIVQEQEVLPL